MKLKREYYISFVLKMIRFVLIHYFFYDTMKILIFIREYTKKLDLSIMVKVLIKNKLI